MKRTELERLTALKAEIKAIERDLAKIEPQEVADVYKDYTRDPSGVTKIMRGSDEGGEAARRLRWRRRRFLRILREKEEEAETFIQGLEDPETRTIVRMVYLQDATQEQVGAALGYERSTIGKKLAAFWEREEADGED